MMLSLIFWKFKTVFNSLKRSLLNLPSNNSSQNFSRSVKSTSLFLSRFPKVKCLTKIPRGYVHKLHKLHATFMVAKPETATFNKWSFFEEIKSVIRRNAMFKLLRLDSIDLVCFWWWKHPWRAQNKSNAFITDWLVDCLICFTHSRFAFDSVSLATFWYDMISIICLITKD